MKNTALLIIDIQNDYFSGGKFKLDNAIDAAEKSAELLDFFREKSAPVFHIQHESLGPDPTFFLPGSEGQKIHESVQPIEKENIIKKHSPNSFLKTDLLEQLKEKKIEKLVITGMMTLMCVDATSRAAKDLGFHCTLVHDATAARALEFNGIQVAGDQVKASFLAALSMVCDEVVSCEEFLAK
jgi:nicotinamidase-related amidase